MSLMSQLKTAQAPAPDSAGPGSSVAPVNAPQVDTSNLSPGAARRFEKLLDSIDRFTSAVQTKSLRLPAGE